MERTPPPGRRGMTLTEVLVALFVMALGLISLLTLFPVGAIQIGLALRDDRCKQTAVQADAFMRAYWQRTVVEPGPGASTDRFVWAFDDPTAMTTDPGTSGRTAGTPSFPVLIDPLGALTYTPSNDYLVAGNAQFGRRNLGQNQGGTGSFFSKPLALQNCTLLDDLTFDRNGVATDEDPSAGKLVTRLGKYNWAAVLQRPDCTVETTASFSILCFGDRPPLLNIGSDSEKTATALVTIGSSVITSMTPPALSNPDSPPLLRKGGWFMDGTSATTPTLVRNAVFYRIVGVTDIGGGQVSLDIDPPYAGPLPTGVTTATLYFFSGLTEVFARPPLMPNP